MISRQALALAGALAVWSGMDSPDHSARGMLIDDHIVVNKAKPKDAVMSLVHGRTAADVCPDAAAIAGGGTHTIVNVRPPSACQVVAFSKWHPLIEQTPSWTDGADEVDIELDDPLPPLEVNIFVSSDDQAGDQAAKADIDHARRLLRRNRVGLTLKRSTFVRSGTLSQANRTIIGDGCDNADAIVQSFPAYEPSRINVFYVDVIDADDWNHGYNCFDTSMSGNSTPRPNIIFISINSRTPATLAHELGHTLGLRGATGHTGPLGSFDVDPNMSGFTSINVMWTGLDFDGGALQNHFSLGQAYRMNATNESWLHSSGGPGGGLPARPCHPHNSLDKTPCPALAVDVP